MRLILLLSFLSACGVSDEQRATETMAALESPDPKVRRAILSGYYKDVIACCTDKLLEMAVSEPDTTARSYAVQALGLTQDPRALPIIESYLHTSRRDSALRAIFGYKDAAKCPTVVREWVAGPDPRPVLERRLRDMLWKQSQCYPALHDAIDTHPERVAEITDLFSEREREAWDAAAPSE